MTAGLAVAVGVGVVVGAGAMRAAWRRAQRHATTARLVNHLAHGRTGPRRRLRAYVSEPPRWLVAQLDELESPLRVDVAWRWWRALLVASFTVGAIADGVVVALLGAAVVAALPIGAAAVVRSRQAAAYDATLAATLDALARGARSGASLNSALGEAAAAVRGAVALDVQRVASSIDRGQQLAPALHQWVNRRPRPSVRLAVGALVLAAESGGPPARVIEEVAGALRTQLQVEGEARSLAAQARLSALVVGLAPIAFIGLTSVTDARSAHMLFGTPVGVSCLAVGLALDALGAVWMHRISESVGR